MKIEEYFEKDAHREGYSWRRVCSVRQSDHPLSDTLLLPSGTNFIVIETFIGEPNLFLERSRPSLIPYGEVISLKEYASALAEVRDEESGRTLPADAESWKGYTPKEFMYAQQFTYAPTLRTAASVEVPQDPKDPQIRATTVFQREAPPATVPFYTGIEFVNNLQLRGFAPGSFEGMAPDEQIEPMGTDILSLAGLILRRPIPPTPTPRDHKAVRSWFARGKLREVTRTSRH